MRFQYRVPPHLAGRAGEAEATIDIEGVDPEDSIPRIIGQRGTFYELPLLEYLARRGPLGGIYVDVGANIGNHTIYFAKFLADHVVAIEPNPRVLPSLERNAEVNRTENVTVIDAAVGAREGVGRLRQPNPINIGGTRVDVLDEATGTAGEQDVPVRTLDGIVGSLADAMGGRVTFLKLDVEGMELAALQGAERILRSDRPQLAIELAGAELRRAVFTFLGEYGYRVVAQFCEHGRIFTYHFVDPDRHRLRGEPTEAERWYATEPRAADERERAAAEAEATEKMRREGAS